MDILTQTISLLFRHRQTEIGRFGQDIDHIQRKQLHALLSTARKTEWGLKYDYKSIRSYSDFCQRLPLQTYDEIKPYVTRMINGERNILWPSVVRWYAKSSGTTNDKSKFLPVTPEILKGCHYKGGFDCVAIYLRNNPESRFFSKKGLILGGSHSPSPLNSEAHQGDLSAVLLQNLNPLVNLIRVPKKPIILMDEWESKIKAIVENTWNKDVNSLSGVPSWMLVLIKAVLKKTDREYLTDVWPNLEVFFHGGISFEPYREQYETLIPSNKMHYMEIYNASEGFFGLQDDPTDPSLLMMPDYGIFYEFIPMDEIDRETPNVVPLWGVETGKNYAMVISTSAGLWRYMIGDTVKFTQKNPYKFIITGRTKFFINAFGEELIVDNAENGLKAACEATSAQIREYTAAPVYMDAHGKCRHQWLIEFAKEPESLTDFAHILDLKLQEINSDYEAKRYKDITLQHLEIIPARKHLFDDWLKSKGKLGGQHKIPRLSNTRTYIDEMLSMNDSAKLEDF